MDLRNAIDVIAKDIAKLKSDRLDEIARINHKYDARIKELETALAVNKEMNTVCLQCGGSGIESFRDAAGSPDHDICKRCHGKGVEPK